MIKCHKFIADFYLKYGLNSGLEPEITLQTTWPANQDLSARKLTDMELRTCFFKLNVIVIHKGVNPPNITIEFPRAGKAAMCIRLLIGREHNSFAVIGWRHCTNFVC